MPNRNLPDLPDLYLPPPKYIPPNSSLSRPSARRLNDAGTRVQEITATLPGYDETVPLVYGEDRMSGLWLVRPYVHIGTGEFRFAILWSWGEIEGVQSIFINGAALPVGVTVTHYVGTDTQPIDPTLGADIPGFADRYLNCAYTVFRVPPATIDGFPQTHQIEAVIRGIKVHDPRTGVVAYSENPALCMADFASRAEDLGGAAKPVFNLIACADRCDQMLGADKRCEIGLTIKHAGFLDDMLDLFAAYAEVLWSYDSGGVLIVPDAPVSAPAAILTVQDFDGDSLQLLGSDMRQSPTSVTIDYRQPTGTEVSWPQEAATQKLPGVDDGLIDDVPSDISLPGIHRSSEANRKALMRLRRLSYPSRFAFQMFDEGVQFQRGDVVVLPDTRGMLSREVRILSIEQVSPGMHQITAEHYDANMYPDDYDPGVTASWPVGTAIFFTGNEVPAGWVRNTDADGWLLFGASAVYPAGTTVGDGNIALAGTTSLAGGHSGSNSSSQGNAWIVGGSLGSGPSSPTYNATEPPHDHDYSLNSPVARTPRYRREALIVKTDGPGDIPVGGQVMVNGSLLSAALTEVATSLGRLAAAGDALDGGQASSFNISPSEVSFTTEPDHDHSSGGLPASSAVVNFGPNAYNHVSAGAHAHGASFPIVLNHKRRLLAFYQANTEAPAQIGAIAMYVGDVGDLIGTGFHECDGANGTVDLVDHFVERRASADAGDSVGDHTLSWTVRTNFVADHNHQGGNVGNLTARRGYHALGAGGHDHDASGSAPYRPPGYAITFIQYTGVI